MVLCVSGTVEIFFKFMGSWHFFSKQRVVDPTLFGRWMGVDMIFFSEAFFSRFLISHMTWFYKSISYWDIH